MQVRAIQNCLNQTDLQPTQRPLRALQQRVRRGQRSRWLTLSTVQACEQADNSIRIRASGPATVRWSERGTVLNRPSFTVRGRRPRMTRGGTRALDDMRGYKP